MAEIWGSIWNNTFTLSAFQIELILGLNSCQVGGESNKDSMKAKTKWEAFNSYAIQWGFIEKLRLEEEYMSYRNFEEDFYRERNNTKNVWVTRKWGIFKIGQTNEDFREYWDKWILVLWVASNLIRILVETEMKQGVFGTCVIQWGLS